MSDRPAGRLLLARHGRTAWNAGDRRLGRANVPLDDVGRAQALALRDALAGRRVDAVYASPLVRAQETARPTAEARGLTVHSDDDLLEFDFGHAAGTSRAEVKLRLRRDHVYRAVPGGESLHDVWLRAGRFLDRIRVRDRRDVLLVVGHHRVNRLLAGRAHGLTLPEAAAAKQYRWAPGELIALDPGDGAPVRATG